MSIKGELKKIRLKLLGPHLKDYQSALDHKKEILDIITKARLDPEDTYECDVESPSPWSLQGSSPYIRYDDANYIYTTTKNSETGENTFQDMPTGPWTINSVIFKVETYCVNGNKTGKLRVWDNSASGYVDYDLLFPKNAWAEQSIDVSSIITTEAEVNALKVIIKSANSTNEQRVDYVWVVVNYSAVAAGQPYISRVQNIYGMRTHGGW